MAEGTELARVGTTAGCMVASRRQDPTWARLRPRPGSEGLGRVEGPERGGGGGGGLS